MRTRTPDGQEVEVVDVAVEEATERWSSVVLADGARLKVKPVITGAQRVVGKFDAEGLPIYALKTQQVAVVESAPDEIKAPK